jgi:hypothetical protein
VTGGRRRTLALGVLLLALAAGAWRFYRLRNYAEFVDESGEMTTGWLLSEGETLYKTVFSHHMPLAVAIAHGVAVLSPTDRPAHFRAAPFVAYALLACAVAFGPLGRRHPVAGPLAGASLLALISILAPLLSAQMLLNEVFWGIAFSIAFVLLPLPLLLAEEPRMVDALGSGAAAALAVAGSPAAALPLLLLAGITVLESSRRSILRRAAPFLVGVLGVCACLGTWAFRFADGGGFRKEVVDFNADIYVRFAGPGVFPDEVFFETLRAWRAYLAAAVPEAFRGDVYALLVLPTLAIPALLAAGLLGRARRTGGAEAFLRAAAAVALAALVVFSLRMRGSGFHAVPLYIAVATLAVFLPWACGFRSPGIIAAAVALAFAPALGRALWDESLAFHADDRRAASGVLANAARYVTAHTAPGERIAAFPTLPIVYLEAKRRPVTDGIFFLPWQAMREDRDPALDSTCSQLQARPPRYVVLQETTIWKTFAWRDYAYCIDRFLKKAYEPVDPSELHGLVLRRRDAGAGPSSP